MNHNLDRVTIIYYGSTPIARMLAVGNNIGYINLQRAIALNMSVLTDALDRVLDRHTTINPNFASDLLPGLPRKKIIEMMKDIIEPVPEELIELYEWHNGSDYDYCFIPCFEFQPLEYAIEKRSNRYHENNDNWLPIMDCNGDAQIIMMFGVNSDTIPIYCRDMEFGIYEQCFESLTTMIQTIAAYFDEDLYWYDEESRGIQGRNYARCCQIHKQYNPNSAPLRTMYF
jgi:hypothetical protein